MKRLNFCILSLLLVCGCAKENTVADSARKVSLHVGIDSPSKVELDALKTVWNSGDMVSSFLEGEEKNLCWKYIGEDKARTGKIEFAGESMIFQGNQDGAVFIYPYDETYSADVGAVSVVIPDHQDYRNGSYGYTLLAGKCSGTAVIFKYSMAMIRLSLEGKGTVQSVTLSGNGGEVLCGPARLEFQGENPVLEMSPEAGGKEVTVSCNSKNVGEIFFSIPAGTYPGGFTATLNLSSGKKKIIRHTMPVTLKAGEFMTLSDVYDDVTIYHIDFTADPQTSSALIYRLPTATLIKPDVIEKFKFGDNREIEVWSKVGLAKQTVDSGARIVALILSSYLLKNNVEYGGPGYSWIKFPAISGKRLVEVRAGLYSVDAAFKPSSLNVSSAVKTDGSGLADMCPSVEYSGKCTVTLPLSGSVPDKPYYFCTGYQQNTKIEWLDLYYGNY